MAAEYYYWKENFKASLHQSFKVRTKANSTTVGGNARTIQKQ